MIRLAITGGIACGKSLVGGLLTAHAIPVCDTDILAHQAMVSGGEIYKSLVARYGPTILLASGEINRSRLGQLVFQDAREREYLNRIIHPPVMAAWRQWLAAQTGQRCAAVLIPLLYEVGAAEEWDAVICVSSPEPLQRQRLRQRGLTDEEISLRLNAQWPIAAKMERADFVIANCGTIALVEEQTRRIMNILLGG